MRYISNKCHMRTVFHQLTHSAAESEEENMRIKLGFPMVSCHRKHKRVGAALLAAAGLAWIFIKMVATVTSSNAGYSIHESHTIFLQCHNSLICNDERQMQHSAKRIWPCHENDSNNTPQHICKFQVSQLSFILAFGLSWLIIIHSKGKPT